MEYTVVTYLCVIVCGQYLYKIHLGKKSKLSYISI